MDNIDNMRKGKLKGLQWCKKNFYNELKDDSKIMLCEAIEELENMVEVKPIRDEEWEDSRN